MATRSKIGIFGAGWVGLVTGACFAELGHEVVIRDVVPEKIATLAAGRGSVPRAGRAGAAARGTPSGSRSRSTSTTSPTASSSSSASTRRRPTPATPTCLASGRSIDELPELTGRPILVMKSTVPVGTGEKVRAGLDERGLEHVGYVVEPRVPRRGPRGPRLHESGPDRRRRLRRRRRRRRRGPLRGHRRRRSCAPTSTRPR